MFQGFSLHCQKGANNNNFRTPLKPGPVDETSIQHMHFNVWFLATLLKLNIPALSLSSPTSAAQINGFANIPLSLISLQHDSPSCGSRNKTVARFKEEATSLPPLKVLTHSFEDSLNWVRKGGGGWVCGERAVRRLKSPDLRRCIEKKREV